jgi:hypothetical protein
VISDDEYYYDYVHTFVGRPQASSCDYSKTHLYTIRGGGGGGGECHPTQTVETLKRNDAYDMWSVEVIEDHRTLKLIKTLPIMVH